MKKTETEKQIHEQIEQIMVAEQNICSFYNEGAYGELTRAYHAIACMRRTFVQKGVLLGKVLIKRLLAGNIAGTKRVLKCLVRKDMQGLKREAISEDVLNEALSAIRAGQKEIREGSVAFRQCRCTHQEAILRLIDAYHRAGRKTIIIMAPYFTDERLADGYFQRVQAVDRILGENTLKIYASWLDADEINEQLHCHVIDQTHIEITYPHLKPDCDAQILEIARRARIAYHHSVAFANEVVTKDDRVYKVFDMHGAYPEELRLYGREEQADLDERQEMLAMKYGQCVVCVTESMVEHLKQKYAQLPEKVILLPIFDMERLEHFNFTEKPNGERYTVVYAGGMQKWQKIDQMQEVIYRTTQRYRYKVFTSKPQEFWKQWRYGFRPRRVEVSAKTPDEVLLEYESCHFGFVLRDDIDVNHVACPTKLVEYIAAGVIPILSTTRIGDFVSDGMKYISLEEFEEGKLPSNQEREEMVNHNREVLQTMKERYQVGCRQICTLIDLVSERREKMQ